MKSQTKWFILLIIVNPGFEEVYDSKTNLCDKFYKTTEINITKFIRLYEFSYNYIKEDVILNISFIIKTPTPGASAYICLSYREFGMDGEGYYCTIYTGSFIELRVNQKVVPTCPKRAFLRNRGSWFVTNLVLTKSKSTIL